MALKSKRVALTLPHHLDSTLEQLSQLEGVPKTKIITDLLLEAEPVLNNVLEALLRIKADKSTAAQVVREFAAKTILDGTEQLGFIATESKKL